MVERIADVGAAPKARRRSVSVGVWFRAHQPTAQERRQIIQLLALTPGPRWRFRFSFMLGLSVVIAVMGLVADSAAVVIGAMLVAPLMTPVMAFAASTAMGWVSRMARFAAVVASASAGSIALAWVLAAVLPSPPLTTEILTRTSPGVIDLLVALAAGAAGAYATVRPDVSTSLPGVAVAVALVPPLATVGITLQLGRADLARGALLLYLANLVAIVLCGVVVFVLTGFVPASRIRHHRRRFTAGVSSVVVVALGVSVPLVRGTYRGIQEAQRVSQVNQTVANWLFGSELDLVDVALFDRRVVVDVAGAAEPPSTQSLTDALVGTLGEGVEVTVRWSQRSERNSGPLPPTDEREQLLSQARSIVVAWLATYSERATEFDIQSIELTDSRLHVELSGPVAPPPAATLADELSAALDRTMSVDIRWSERLAFTGTPGEAPPAPDLSAQIQQEVQRWAATQQRRPVVQRLDIDRTTKPLHITVELSGEEQPKQSADLQENLERVIGDDAELEVWFTPRSPVPVSPTTTSLATTTTSTLATGGPTGNTAPTAATASAATS